MMTPLMQAAIQMHEFFLALMDAGFSRDEALEIVIASLKGPIDEK